MRHLVTPTWLSVLPVLTATLHARKSALARHVAAVAFVLAFATVRGCPSAFGQNADLHERSRRPPLNRPGADREARESSRPSVGSNPTATAPNRQMAGRNDHRALGILLLVSFRHTGQITTNVSGHGTRRSPRPGRRASTTLAATLAEEVPDRRRRRAASPRLFDASIAALSSATARDRGARIHSYGRRVVS